MPLYKHRDKILLHIHVPKTGGTTIMNDLEDRGVAVSYITKASKPEYGNVPPQHMTLEYTMKYFDLDQTKSFAVIRHPWQRTVSEYVWRKKSNKFNNLNSWIKETLTDIDHAQHQNHFLPQTQFIDRARTKLFRYDAWDSICEWVGKELAVENFTTKYWKQKRLDYTLPSFDLLDVDAKSLWKNLYREDLDLYNQL